MNAHDNLDDVEQLHAKVEMLTAALRKMDAECAQKVTRATNNLIDCAACFTEQADWHAALYRAIGKMVEPDGDDLTGLSFSDCDTVNQLAAIGRYLADDGYCSAENFRKKADGAV